MKWFSRIRKTAKAAPPSYFQERISDLYHIRRLSTVEPGNAKKALIQIADQFDDHNDDDYAAEIRGIASIILDSPWRAKGLINGIIETMNMHKLEYEDEDL